MRKGLLIIFTAVFVLMSVACTPSAGNSKNVKIEIGSSEKFTEAEIRQAADAVKEKFKDFTDCELLRLYYDEERSDSAVKSFLENGKGSINGARAENTIVLHSDFYAGSKAEGGFTPDMEYTNWMFILIRDNETSRWHVDGCGY